MKDYVDTGKVKFYFRQYAFLGPASTVAANAAECANEQGKFWDMHDYFYDNQPPESDTSMFTTDKLTEVAGQLGMDTNQFTSCLSSNKYDKNVSQDLSEGQKAGVTATPTVFVNGTPTVGAESYDVFKQAIDQELQKS
jgi:protein-disulfide isomerase